MNELYRWWNEKRMERVIKALRSHGFRTEYFDDQKLAVEWVLEEAREATYIGVGGSLTVRELGLVEALEKQGKTVFDHWKTTEPQEALKVRRAQLTSDLFLSGANAVTESGEIINMDASGNRIAALSFGPRRVIILAGINKLVDDIQQAYRRIQDVAAPINAQRLGLKTPCVKIGRCTDCDSPQRICNASLVLHRRPAGTDMAVVLIGQTLGC